MKKKEELPDEADIEEIEDINSTDNLEEQEESPAKKTIKKVYILSIAVFLVLLLLANSFGAYVFQIFAGKIVSTTLTSEYTLQLKNATIFFGKENYDALLEYYKANQKTEIKVCLLGEKQGSNYIINALYIPKTYQKEVYSVTAQICDKDTIISLHTHPYLHCIFSNQDIESYNKYRNINPDAIMALMCDEKRFSFFGY